MKSRNAAPHSTSPKPKALIEQPTSWPLFYTLPQTRYVKRQRAVNASQYDYRPQASATHYVAQSKRLSFLQHCRNRIANARMKIWISVKLAGRRFVHKLIKWCILPLSIAACLSMVDALPAELPDSGFNVDYAVQIAQE